MMQAMSMRSVDRMSGLPDELLIRILSSVTTRQAVQTSLLSKRWRHVWTSIPVLYFYDSEFPEYQGGDSVSPIFLSFIEEVMRRKRENNNITKFYFSADKVIDANIVRKWILHSVRGRKVRNFTIKSAYYGEEEERIELPPCLFACRSLRVLKLSMGSNSDIGPCSLKLPTTLCDSMLKSLHLEHLLFDELQRLISYCPFLEDLKLRYLFCGDLKISARRLEKLTMYGCNVATLEVSAPSLLSFNFDCCWDVRNCSLKNLVSLVVADINISCNEHKKILEGISNVSSLTLTYSGIQRQDLPDDLPMFKNLTCLKLHICFNKLEIEVMIYILKHSPNLKTLVIYNDESEDWYKQVEQEKQEEQEEECCWWIEIQQSDQFLPHLRKIKIENYQSSAMQLEIQQGLVKYLLKNSLSMEEIMITYDKVT